jgi:serine/threonine protein kinase
MQPVSGHDTTNRVWSRGDEPIPGHQLIARLGGGGAGEVWKAQSAGGFTVALKFVPLAAKMGEAELRSLEVLKNIRHPNLLAIFGAWQQQNHLIIAMELGDKTLHDRHREEVKLGRAGIPRVELLEYMREAAKGIDYLNNPGHSLGGKEGVSIQHRDIKPQNMLLLGNSVKLADFGLAKVLEGNVTSHTGALTIAYAPPELLQGLTSNRSDQYSLAASYCLLRTGRVPYPGSLAQIYAAQLSQTPDLSMLPDAERPILRRALALNPDDRWPSCRAFVTELLELDPDSSEHIAVGSSDSKAASASLRGSAKLPSSGGGFPADTSEAADFATVSSSARPQRIADSVPSSQSMSRKASAPRHAAAAGDIAQPNPSGPRSSVLGDDLVGWWQAYRVVIIVFALTVVAALISFIVVEHLRKEPVSKPPIEPVPDVQPNDDDRDEAEINDPVRPALGLPSWQVQSIALTPSRAPRLADQRHFQSASAVWMCPDASPASIGLELAYNRIGYGLVRL